jgi:hypothetical protein
MRLILGLAICSLLVAATAGPGVAAGEPRSGETTAVPRELVGVWKLLSLEDLHDGKPGFYDPDLGPKVAGYLIVDEHNFACIQGMKVDRPPATPTAEESAPSDAELLTMLRGFFGYCVENLAVRGGSLVGRMVVSNDVSEVGTDWERPFTLTADRLLLTPEWIDQGVRIQRTAIFVRMR